MDGFLDLPGAGRIRVATSADVSRALQARTPAPARPARALTASASRLSSGEYSKRLSQPWQLRALGYYDLIGELRFASHFLARMMSRVRFYPAFEEADGSLTPITEGPPLEVLNRIKDPGGGRSLIQYRYGLLQMVTGEGVLFGYAGGERWKFLWKEEVKILDDGTAVRLDANKQETSDRGVAYRMWTPHPRHSDEPDSPVRAVMDICEELIILTLSVRSTATTRMTRGILAMAQGISPNPSDVDGYQGDEDPENNPFLADYIEHVSNQRENPGSPEAAIPFLAEIPDEFMDNGIRWIQTHDPQTDYMEKDLRKEAIQRLALGMDMPPEALLGMTDANHWTAKQVMHDMWRTHGIPKAEQFADDVSEAYLRPALEEEDFSDWSRVVVGYDDSQVVISPDRTEDADRAYDRGQINDQAYLDLKGFPASMRASEEDRKIWLAVKLRNPSFLKGTAFEIEAPEPAPGIPGPDSSQNGRDAAEGPADPGTRLVSRQEARTASARIHGAAELALLRCRELAGVRIRHKCKDCAQGHPDAVVAAVLGPEAVPDPLKLVKGGTDGFRSYLIASGMDEAQAEVLCQVLEVYAAKTLCEERMPEQLPSGFIAQVEKAREVSRAVGHSET